MSLVKKCKSGKSGLPSQLKPDMLVTTVNQIKQFKTSAFPQIRFLFGSMAPCAAAAFDLQHVSEQDFNLPGKVFIIVFNYVSFMILQNSPVYMEGLSCLIAKLPNNFSFSF